MAFRSLRICASVGGWQVSSGSARNGEYETLFRTPSILGAEAWVCQIAQAKACRHATSATTATRERIALYSNGAGEGERCLSPRHRRGFTAAQNLADRGRISSIRRAW